MRRAALAASLTVLSLLAAAPADAALHVCNKTGLKTRVALGRFDGTEWSSSGWWIIAPGTCAALVDGPLKARYYYLYATDGAAGIWEGQTHHFCVAPGDKFQVRGRTACAARGYDRRGFLEIDTGNAPDWTQTLSN